MKDATQSSGDGRGVPKFHELPAGNGRYGVGNPIQVSKFNKEHIGAERFDDGADLSFRKVLGGQFFKGGDDIKGFHRILL
jgi:hypothetical protein